MKRIKRNIRLYFLFQKVKSSNGICTSWLRGKPHCAKWVNIYAGFLDDKEKDLFHALVRIKKLIIAGEYTLSDRNGSLAITNPIYKQPTLNPNTTKGIE